MGKKSVKAKDAPKGKPGKDNGAKAAAAGSNAAPPGKSLSNKEYLRKLKKLHAELVKLQEWVEHEGLKVCIVFEAATALAKAGRSKPLPSASVRGCFG